jgi:hypothetical protein
MNDFEDKNENEIKSYGFMSPMVNNIIEVFTDEIKKESNRKKIMKDIIDPILQDINAKYYPHLISLVTLLMIIIILLILLLLMNRCKCNLMNETFRIV